MKVQALVTVDIPENVLKGHTEAEILKEFENCIKEEVEVAGKDGIKISYSVRVL